MRTRFTFYALKKYERFIKFLRKIKRKREEDILIHADDYRHIVIQEMPELILRTRIMAKRNVLRKRKAFFSVRLIRICVIYRRLLNVDSCIE